MDQRGTVDAKGNQTPGYETFEYEMSTYSRRVSDPCQEAIATLYSFLDGELTPGQASDDPVPPGRVLALFRGLRFRGRAEGGYSPQVPRRRAGFPAPAGS